jgi:hypothetical protein
MRVYLARQRRHRTSYVIVKYVGVNKATNLLCNASLGTEATRRDMREERAVPTLWWEPLRMTSEFMLIGGQNLGARSRDHIYVKGVWVWVVYE